jgi:hypothetical protein
LELNLGLSLLTLMVATSFSSAQNYAMVDTGRLSLFSNGWETRGIEIESVVQDSIGGTDYVNYPTVEITVDGARLMSGKGWLGGTINRANNVDMVINHLGDTLNFHTAQPVGFSWIFFEDDVDQITTATIETAEIHSFIGLLDSVKTVKFETTHLGIPSPTWIDSIQVRVSQNYGLVEGFNFYEYPTLFSSPELQYKVNHHHKFMVNYAIPDTTYTLRGMETFAGNFGEVRLTPAEVFDIPDSLRYTRYYYDYEYGGGGGDEYNTLYDHLVFDQNLTTNISEIDAHTCIHSWSSYGGMALSDTDHYSMDTLTVTTDYSDVWFEGRPYEYSPSFDGFQVTLHLTTNTGRRLLYIIENFQNPGLDTLNLDNTHHRDGFMDQLGRTYDYYNHSTGSGLNWSSNVDARYLTYYKIGSEEYIGSTSLWSYNPYEYDHDCIDQFLPEDTTGTGIQDLETDIRLYPNPNEGSFIVESKTGQTIHILDMQGRQVDVRVLNSGKTQIQIDQPGLYLLKTEDWIERVVITK